MTVDEESIAHETKVKIGIKQGDKVQIVEGLGEGETVVVEGNYALPDGTKVEIAKDEEEKDGKTPQCRFSAPPACYRMSSMIPALVTRSMALRATASTEAV